MYTIGIVGFGVVGLSGLKFFIKYPAQINKFLGLEENEPVRIVIWSQITMPAEHEALFAKYGIEWNAAASCSLWSFFSQIDKALVSPGINLVLASHFSKKIFCELDLFQYCFAGKSIGITGSLGKTTVTKVIYQLLKQKQDQQKEYTGNVVIGGNIGIGMLDLLDDTAIADSAVLELSSFQLERSHIFAPTIGVWTNLYANHLDRHLTILGYFEAKALLFKQQPNNAIAVLGTQLFDQTIGDLTIDLLKHLKSALVVAGAALLTQQFIDRVPCKAWTAFMVRDGLLGKYCIVDGVIVSMQTLLAVSDLPSCTFGDNWAIIFAALDAAGSDCVSLVQDLQNRPELYSLDDQHHRLEFVHRVMGIDFYNDSKSTVKESTLAAARQLASTYNRVHVIIGGLGKGVDRSDFVPMLKLVPAVITVIAFGKEAPVLGAELTVSSLDQALHKVLVVALSGDAVLFSPGGASFDLFKNYESRGNCFKELVMSLRP
jgi:UDP-N-acetylmuramoylalanine--D-glutamate ligase